MGEHDEEISLVDLLVGQQVLGTRMSGLEILTSRNHKQNSTRYHRLRNDLQALCDKVWKLEIKVAVYSALGASLGSFVSAYIKHLIDR